MLNNIRIQHSKKVRTLDEVAENCPDLSRSPGYVCPILFPDLKAKSKEDFLEKGKPTLERFWEGDVSDEELRLIRHGQFIKYFGKDEFRETGKDCRGINSINSLLFFLSKCVTQELDDALTEIRGKNSKESYKPGYSTFHGEWGVLYQKLKETGDYGVMADVVRCDSNVPDWFIEFIDEYCLDLCNLTEPQRLVFQAALYAQRAGLVLDSAGFIWEMPNGNFSGRGNTVQLNTLFIEAAVAYIKMFKAGDEIGNFYVYGDNIIYTGTYPFEKFSRDMWELGIPITGGPGPLLTEDLDKPGLDFLSRVFMKKTFDSGRCGIVAVNINTAKFAVSVTGFKSGTVDRVMERLLGLYNEHYTNPKHRKVLEHVMKIFIDKYPHLRKTTVPGNLFFEQMHLHKIE